MHFKLYPIYLDKSFTKEEAVIINQVIDEWNYALNGSMKIQIASGTFDDTNQKAIDAITDKINKTGEGMMLLGLNQDNSALEKYLRYDENNSILAFVNGLGNDAHLMFVIRDRIGLKNLHKILLHEFGHALGAAHVNTFSLMYPGYGPNVPDCIDKITLAQVSHYHGLDLDRLNYCSIKNFE